ncbi:MAG TPA: GNAT family N-acetyltransferase [Longimicrobium sp.]
MPPNRPGAPGLAFRPLAPDDFPLLLEWLQRPHVREWWDDGDDTLEKVAAHYGADDGTARFLMLEHDPATGATRPAGYFQHYAEADGVIGIDQFLADGERLGQGMGTRAVRAFVEQVIAPLRPRRIILDPDPRNARAIRCYEKAGFHHVATVDTGGGTHAYMMAIDCAADDTADPI